MNEVKRLEEKIKCLETNLKILKHDLQSLNTKKTTRTGKICSLNFNQEYFIVSYRGTIYSRRLQASTQLHLTSLNNARKLYLTYKDAEKGLEEENNRIKLLDYLDSCSE